jgi:hypothetical protein
MSIQGHLPSLTIPQLVNTAALPRRAKKSSGGERKLTRRGKQPGQKLYRFDINASVCVK